MTSSRSQRTNRVTRMTVVLFIIGVTLLTLYGLTVSGHFPFEARQQRAKNLHRYDL